MFILKIVGILLFLASWLTFKKSNKNTSITDVFFVFFAIVYIPYFLFNPQATSTWSQLVFSSEEVFRADLIVYSFFIGGIILFCSQLYLGKNNSNNESRLDSSFRVELFLSCLASLAAILFWIYFALHKDYWDFHASILKFLAGEMPLDEYRLERNVKFSKSYLINEILGYLRYTILPVLFLMIIYPLLKGGRYFFVMLVSLIYFFALPLSFAKLPLFCFFGYLILLYFQIKRGGLSFRLFAVASLLMVAFVVYALGQIYKLQWVGVSAPDPLHSISPSMLLAVERVWGESYSVILRYCSVYPDKLPFTGLSGIGLLSKIFNLDPRMPDLEVVRALLGANDTASNPGLFVLGGYAAYGFGGALVFIVIGFFFLYLLDIVATHLYTVYIYRIYKSLLMVNVLFLLQVSLQTTFITYGLVVIPMLLFLFDRLLFIYLKRTH